MRSYREARIQPGRKGPARRGESSCCSGRDGLGHLPGGGFGIHPHHFPDMAVRVFKTAAVHEAEILRRGRIDHRADGLRLADNAIDIRAAVGRDADQQPTAS
jgi:hypothetical protein